MARQQLPPGPSGNLMTGSTFDLRRDPLGFLTGLAREYGDVACFRIGFRRVYQLNHPDMIRDVFVTHSKRFQKTGLMKQARSILGEGLFLSEGEFHRRQRRLIQPAFSRERIAAYAALMVDAATDLRDQWDDGGAVDISDEMFRLTLPIVTKTLFQIDLDEGRSDLREAFTTVIQYFQRFLAPRIGGMAWLPSEKNRRFREARKLLNETVFRIIRDVRRNPSDEPNVLAQLIAATDDEGDGTRMNDQQLRDEVMTLLVAGHETVATALTWTWYLLAKNPDAEAKLHQELESVLGNRRPTAADVPNLRFARMVVAEAMRLFPPVWALSRKAVEDHPVAGYTIPRGALVGVSQYVMHRDARYYENPDQFDPSRWTEEQAALRPRYSYFPFGGGPRLCIGEPFAWMESVLVLATLGQKWRLRLVTDDEVELAPMVTLRPKHGIAMRIEQRNDHPAGQSHTVACSRI